MLIAIAFRKQILPENYFHHLDIKFYMVFTKCNSFMILKTV